MNKMNEKIERKKTNEKMNEKNERKINGKMKKN